MRNERPCKNKLKKFSMRPSYFLPKHKMNLNIVCLSLNFFNGFLALLKNTISVPNDQIMSQGKIYGKTSSKSGSIFFFKFRFLLYIVLYMYCYAYMLVFQSNTQSKIDEESLRGSSLLTWSVFLHTSNNKIHTTQFLLCKHTHIPLPLYYTITY